MRGKKEKEVTRIEEKSEEEGTVRKSFDVLPPSVQASGWMVDPKLAPLLEGADWFIKRSQRPHASEHDGINAGITLYLIHYRGTPANLI